MSNLRKAILASIITITAYGCSSTKLEPGAEKVMILPTAPKKCKYLGEVTGNQGNFFTGGFTSNSNMETGARNDMKNKAFKMGGNVLVMLTNRAGVTGSGSYHNGHGSSSTQQTNVTYTGVAYNCPQSSLDDL